MGSEIDNSSELSLLQPNTPKRRGRPPGSRNKSPLEYQPPVKRKRGRPPNHPPVNQYTGVRAKNIDYVRRYLRAFLEDESLRPQNLYTPNTMKARLAPIRLKTALASYYKTTLTACRLLLACEGIHIWAASAIKSREKTEELTSRLRKLGDGLKDGSVRMPDLLSQLDDLEREAESDDEI